MKLLLRLRAARCAVFLLPLGWACLAILAAPTSSPAQQIAAAGPIVRSIDIQYAGPANVNRDRILGNMRTAVGQPFSQANVEEDIRNLYGTGDITNVRMFSEPAGDGVKVIVIVQTRSSIKEIVVTGATKFSPKSILRKLTSKAGGSLNEEVIEQDRQKIIDLYSDHGYQSTEVKSSISMDEQAGNGVVTFAINEGARGVLHSVRFEGNEHIKSSKLRSTMKGTRGKTILSFITKDGRLDQGKLKEDLDAIRDLYQEKGYIDIEVVDTRMETRKNGDVDLTVILREGIPYHVGTLNFEGTQIFTDAEIRRFLKMKEGSVYSPKSLKDDVKTISDYYGSRGYVDVRVAPDGTPNGPGTVNLKYKIEEGGQSYVERVNIEGNTLTKDKVIRREIPIAPGDVANTVLIDAAKKRLDNLGYFEKVDASPTDTSIPGRKDVDIVVQEKRTGSLSFGAGFSSIESLLGQIELTQTNFDILNWPSFTGGGQKFRLLLQYGLVSKDFSASFTEPYFLDYRLSLGGEIFYRDSNFISNDYDQQNVGFAITARKALGRYVSTSLEYRFEDIKISNVNNDSSILAQESGSRTRSAVKAGLSYDTRDSVFLTRRGSRVDFSPYIAGGVLGGNTEIFGLDLSGSHYQLFPFDTILTLNGEIATVDTYGDGDRVPVYDRLYAGGAANLRGFGFRKVGPKDYKGNPIGGRTLVRGTAEYTFPIVERARGAAFYDIGYVNQDAFAFTPETYYSRSDFRSDPNRIDTDPRTPIPNKTNDDSKNTPFGGGLNMDIGVGLRLDLPIGPLRLDYGYPLLGDGFNKRTYGKFNFNVGYQF